MFALSTVDGPVHRVAFLNSVYPIILCAGANFKESMKALFPKLAPICDAVPQLGSYLISCVS